MDDYLRRTNGMRAMKCLFGLMIFLLGASMAVAQQSTGTILGTVKDPSGQVVVSANVTARNLETGLTRTATTSDDGSYRLSGLSIGGYTIEASHEGFSVQSRSGLTLTVGQEAVVNFTLALGSVSQTVSVTGEAPLIDTTSGALADLVDEQKIADLPLNGRNYVDLMMLQPGIAQQVNKGLGGGQIGTWFSSNGAPVRSNNMLLDGAILNNIMGAGASSASGSTLGVDGIREWRVVTNSFSAEYGMTMGSQMVIASKGGSNAFHGTAFEYIRNEKLDATNFFYVPTAATGFARIPPYKRNNFGASFGGPIKKDKTFFYAVYEGLRERLGVSPVDTVLPAACYNHTTPPPGGSALFSTQADATACGGTTTVGGVTTPNLTTSSVIPAVILPFLGAIPQATLPKNQYTYPYSQPTNESYGQIRVDQNISASDSFFGRYTVDDALQQQTGGFKPFSIVYASRNQYLTLSENHVFSSSLLNTARVSFSRTNINEYDPASGLAGPALSFRTGYDFGSLSIGGVTTFQNVGAPPATLKQNLFGVSDDVFKSVGRHALKFGVLVNHIQDPVYRGSSLRGSVTFPGVSTFMLGTPSSYSETYLPGSIIGRYYHYNTLGFYAQDDVRVRSNLTLNLGLRYEVTTTVTEIKGNQSSFRNITDAAPTVGPAFNNPSLRNFGPRVGFAWDVMGDGKMAVRGGAGLLYDIAGLGFALLQANQLPPFGSQGAVTVPSGTLLSLPLAFPTGGTPGVAINGMQWNMKQPQMYQWNLTVDRQLPGNMALSVTYAGSRGLHLIQTTDGNPTIPTSVTNGQPFWAGGNPRLNTQYGTYQVWSSSGASRYNSLQVQLTKRMSKGFQLQGSYSYARVTDNLQGQAGAESSSTPVYPEYPQNLNFERGPATFDISQNLRFNAIYQFPDFHSKQGFAGYALSGWRTTGILSVQTGYPFTPVLQTNRSQSKSAGGATVVDRPNLAPGRSISSILHGTSTGCTLSNGSTIASGTALGTPTLWYDPCGFALPSIGSLGNVSRDSFRGPHLTNLDFSIIKDTPLKFREGAILEFRAEFFNLLNHPNFITPQFTGLNTAGVVFSGKNATENPLPTAGVLNNTSNTAREIQFALKILF